MVSDATKIRAAFIVLAVVLWYGTTHVVDNTSVQILVLLGVGVLAPRIVEAWRERDSV